jgi:hypothetical protein
MTFRDSLSLDKNRFRPTEPLTLRSGKFAENLCADGFPAAVHGEFYVRGHAEDGGIKIV